MRGGTATLRTLVFALGVACFFLFGLVVYRDDPAGNTGGFVRLSEQGQRGLGLWRDRNCHVCHQLFGMGGYLGPDLTHVSQRVDEDAFRQILRVGTGPMPPAALDAEGQSDIYAFLSEMGGAGQGHLASGGTPRSWQEVFAAGVRGGEVFTRLGCGQCHEPFRLGRLASPDLSRTVERLSRQEIEDGIRRGRGNMPSFGSIDQVSMNDLLDFLQSLNEQRESFAGARRDRATLPWWNYKKQAGAP